MKTAYVAIREAPTYRREAFVAGLAACGYEIVFGPPQSFNAGTVFVCWNRYHENHTCCARVEAAGGLVLIAENGYIGPGGSSPHGMSPREWFALARGYHNDSAVLDNGGPQRWDALGVELKAWRETGGHVLVCPNRSFGTPGRIMPPNWTEETAQRLKKITKREIRVRPHPGNNAPAKPLAEDLAGAWSCVIWSSSSGVHALVAGVPVFCMAPHWIAKEATCGQLADIERPPIPNRLPSLERLAWAQWSLAEIQSGEAFHHHLLRRAGEGEVHAAD